MNASRWALTLPKMPTGLWGVIVALVAEKLVAPALRYLAEKVDDWADGEPQQGDNDDTPAPNEEAVIRLLPERARHTLKDRRR